MRWAATVSDADLTDDWFIFQQHWIVIRSELKFVMPRVEDTVVFEW